MAGVARQTFRSLRFRNARLFFVGIFVSNAGAWVQATATALLAKRLAPDSQDGRVLGVTIALQFVPMLFLGAWAGALADRHNRWRLTLVMQALMAVQALGLAAIDFTGHESLPLVYAFSLALGLISAFDSPARRGVVTELVPEEDITNALSLNTSAMTGSRVFGPALGAWLVGSFGTAWCFLVNGVSFAAIIFALLAMRRQDLFVRVPAAKGGKPVREGLAYIWHDQRLRVVFAIMIVVSTFAFNYSITLALLADDRFGDETLFGWLLAVLSLGSVSGSLFVASRRHHDMRLLFVVCLGLGVFGLAMAWAPNRVGAFVVAVPLGFCGAGYVALCNGISQAMCPPAMRSRLLAFGAVAFLGSTPIGGPITGWVGDVFSAEWSLAYGSVITILTIVVAASYLRSRAAPGEIAPPT